MDTINLLRIAVTVLSFAAFMGIIAYAMSPRNARRFEEATDFGVETVERAVGVEEPGILDASAVKHEAAPVA